MTDLVSYLWKSVNSVSNICDETWRSVSLLNTFEVSFELFRVKEINRKRYDTRCYFNVRSKADMSQLNLPHENDN